ncbi:MAG: hypothetical protein ACI3VS_01550 [Evtepia sp.]
MIIRQLEKESYDRLCAVLDASAHIQPLDPSYSVTIFQNGSEYILKLQPEAGGRIAVLHALEVLREADGPAFILVTEDKALSQYLDLFLHGAGVG